MSIKLKYILFIATLHIILCFITYRLLQEQKWLFLASEMLILFSLFLSYQLYKSFIKPIEFLKSGTEAIADADFSIKYLSTGSSDMNVLVDVFNNMIEKLREERIRLTEQSYFMQKLIEVTPLGIIIMNFDGEIYSINPAAKKLLNINTADNPKTLSFDNNPLVEKFSKIESGQSAVVEINGINKYKCQINEVIHQGFKRKFILLDDLSSELLKSEKEAYGRIIRMMAHEVNNSMGAVNSILDSVAEFGFTKEEDIEYKDSLLLAKERNISLARFMANFASILRLPEPQNTLFDLVTLIKKTGQLFLPTANDKNITIHFELPNEAVTAKGDPILLEQAFSNIIKNAIEAIGQNGNLWLKLDKDPLTIDFTNDGKEISTEVAQKLFKPFFSTKAQGQGIGLMLIREILEKHKYSFSLKTDPKSKLTTFKLIL